MTTYKTTEIINLEKVKFLINSATANEELGKAVISGLKKLKSKNVVKYKYAKDYPSGRQVSTSYSLQLMPNRVRGFITEGYIDYDIVNAHYNILYKLCEENGIDAMYIKEYCVNREEVIKKHSLNKKFMLTFLYQDKPKCFEKNFLDNLSRELENAKKKLISIHLDKVNDHSNTKNPDSSKLSQIIDWFENDALMKVVKHFSLKDAVLIYDGLMTKIQLNTGTLKELTGLEWKIKPFEPMDIDEEEEETDYTIQKEKMEKNNFITLEPFLRYSRANDKYEYSIQTKSDFEQRNAIYYTTDSMGVKTPIIYDWLADPNKRYYDKTVFNPNPQYEENNSEYNLFKKFKVNEYQHSEEVDISKFKDLVYHLSGNNDENRDYLINFLAHIFQFPHINPQVCIVLKGKQGTGKDTLTGIIERIMGKCNNYLVKVADIQRVVGNFTECLDQKLVVQINEMDGKDGASLNNRIKDMITTEVNLINRKYQALQTQVNYIRWFIYSNNISPIVVEQTDRRFFICETADDLVGNRDWFLDFYDLLDDNKYIYAIYKYLMDIDLTKYKPKEIPRNADKRNLQLCNISPIHRFLRDETIPYQVFIITKQEYHCITVSDLYSEYQDADYFRGEPMKLFKKIILNMKGVELKRPVIDGKVSSKYWFAINLPRLTNELKILAPDIEPEIAESVRNNNK